MQTAFYSRKKIPNIPWKINVLVYTHNFGVMVDDDFIKTDNLYLLGHMEDIKSEIIVKMKEIEKEGMFCTHFYQMETYRF